MFGGAKSWAERTVQPKPCKECKSIFAPKAGGSLYCPDCVGVVKRRNHTKAMNDWRAKNPEKHGRTKTIWDLKKYNLTIDDYERMLAEQNGKCPICDTTEPGGRGVHRKFVVDHCHSSGKVRGLLCHKCNTALGLFADDVNRLEKARWYLDREIAKREGK